MTYSRDSPHRQQDAPSRPQQTTESLRFTTLVGTEVNPCQGGRALVTCDCRLFPNAAPERLPGAQAMYFEQFWRHRLETKKQELEIGCRQALYGMNAVSERLGHSTINIALDTYSHIMPDMQDEAAEKLNGVLKAAMGAASRRRR